jgi:glycosyltransferase involved in cell wall biosynthesis
LRVCLVYDCLYPHTVGGAERWYRNLAEALAATGHDVTYLTLRQWPKSEPPDIPGVRVVSVGPSMPLYTGGRRRILPPLRFGAGVLVHLLRHGRRYEVVQTASFPYFSLLAAALVRRVAGYQIVVDWFEVWSRSYWREYLGLGGLVGVVVQRLCMRVRQRAFCFSRLYAQRLRADGLRGEIVVLEGLYTGPAAAPPVAAAEPPCVVFAGRLIPEKRAPSIVPAVALAAQRVPRLRGVIFGDGPERDDVLAAIEAAGAATFVSAPGFVSGDAMHSKLARACCMILPSRREGYGMIVVEAAACGTPSIVVPGPDNAAVELVEDGVNGVIAESAAPEALADAIVRVHRGGEALRLSTHSWFVANAGKLSLASSLRLVLESYATSARR